MQDSVHFDTSGEKCEDNLCFTPMTKPRVYNLKPPFIKVEDMSGKYKPLIIQGMKNWPMTIQDYVTYFEEQDKMKKH